MHEAILGVGWIAGGGVNNVRARALHGATAAVNVDELALHHSVWGPCRLVMCSNGLFCIRSR